jgi:hypothetical protein
MSILNVSNTIIQQRPDFMILMTIGATQRKIDGESGVMKWVPWVTFVNFKVEDRDRINQFADMAFWPQGTGYYDNKPEAQRAAWEWVVGITEEGDIFTMIWNRWATE